MNEKKPIPHGIWLIISFSAAILLWIVISISEKGGVVFAPPWKVVEKLIAEGYDGILWTHIGYSLFRLITGFALGFVFSIPVAFLMGWYAPVRHVVGPWFRFIRHIPPLAYIPLVAVGAGAGERAKVIVIAIASFLAMVVTIYQGILNVNTDLIRAARTSGAGNRDLFFKAVVPSSVPFIFAGARLGLSSSLTTLVAAELTGASKGLGAMVQKASGSYDMASVLLGIIIIGLIGMGLDKIIRFLEKRLTGVSGGL